MDVDGRMTGFYRKMHIPDDPLYYEKFYFTPGDTGFTIAKTKFATRWESESVGDQWYPEAARLFALRGAESFSIRPLLDGSLKTKRPTVQPACGWETMMRSHAIRGTVLYVGAAQSRRS